MEAKTMAAPGIGGRTTGGALIIGSRISGIAVRVGVVTAAAKGGGGGGIVGRRVIGVKEEVVGIGDLVETKGSGAFDVVGGGGVLVRVELEGQPPERLLNLLLVGASPHTQHLARIHRPFLPSCTPLQQNTQSKSSFYNLNKINKLSDCCSNR